MRIKILLAPQKKSALYPYYRDGVRAWIYSILQAADPEYSAFLHGEGYRAKGSRRASFKLFNFGINYRNSPLLIAESGVVLGEEIELIISSPKEEFIVIFLRGLFSSESEDIRAVFSNVDFQINSAELLPELEINGHLEGAAHGVVCRRKNGYFLSSRNGQEEFINALLDNLCLKYRVVFNNITTLISSNDLKLEITRQKYQLLDIDELRVINNFRFKLSGPEEFLKLAYSAGFGEKNTLGCGMIWDH